jgi:hypothetical protein
MIKTEAEKIVMEDSPEAASIQTVTGWVSRTGHFYGSGEQGERTARYDGCTHRKCECGGVVSRSRVKCEACRDKESSKRFKAMKKVKWDGKTPLALYDSDTYFFDMDDIDQYCEEHETVPGVLRLVICYPVKPRELDANDMFCDELPEDGDVQDAGVLAAVEALNQAIRKAEAFSWLPGDTAVTL